MFTQLGWLNQKRDFAMGIGPSRVVGLNIVIRSQQECPPAASALFDALRDMGFDLQVFTDQKLEANEIWFLVSSKT